MFLTADLLKSWNIGRFPANLVTIMSSFLIKDRQVADRYAAAYQIVQQENSATNYVVDHSSETYVIDPQGKLVSRLPHAAPPQEILDAIRKVIKN